MCQPKGFAALREKCEAVRRKFEISLQEGTGTPPRVCMSARITEL
jgi:hypothetical protein